MSDIRDVEFCKRAEKEFISLVEQEPAAAAEIRARIENVVDRGWRESCRTKDIRPIKGADDVHEIRVLSAKRRLIFFSLDAEGGRILVVTCCAPKSGLRPARLLDLARAAEKARRRRLQFGEC